LFSTCKGISISDDAIPRRKNDIIGVHCLEREMGLRLAKYDEIDTRFTSKARLLRQTKKETGKHDWFTIPIARRGTRLRTGPQDHPPRRGKGSTRSLNPDQ
jgi:hypothetical protein